MTREHARANTKKQSKPPPVESHSTGLVYTPGGPPAVGTRLLLSLQSAGGNRGVAGLVQRWRLESRSLATVQRLRIAGARYDRAFDVPGTQYRILREHGNANHRLHHLATNTVLPHVMTHGEADLLSRAVRTWAGDGATNLDQIVLGFAASPARAQFVIDTQVMNDAGCERHGALANTRFEFWRRIGGTQVYLYDTAGATGLATTLTAGHVAGIQAAFANLAGEDVADLDELVLALDKARELAIPVDVTIARLNAIHANIQHVVKARITADHAAIRAMHPGQLDPVFNTAFDSLEIPGSDPHKGGQVVVFINYNTLAGGKLRVVYKPGDLTIDSVLFNTANSVAQQLGGDLSAYQIVPQADAANPDPRLRHYGYLQFVTTGGPTTAADVQHVYSSVGANLALAYVFGLRDIHHENFILLNDRIQLIDMEAATATFTGFDAMELGSMPTGLPGKLCERIASALAAAGISHAAASAWMPGAAALLGQISAGFANGIANMNPGGPSGPAIDAHVTTLARAEARFVPFATRELQNLVGVFQGMLPAVGVAPAVQASFTQLTQDLAQATAVASGSPPRRESQLLRMLRDPDTRAALQAGDVPFWTRRGRSIYSESGNRIVEALRHPRVNRSNTNELNANARRAPANAAAAAADLTANAIPAFGDPQQGILDALRRERQRAGFGPPTY